MEKHGICTCNYLDFLYTIAIAENFQATRDRLTQSRLEKKNKQTMPVIKVDDVDNSSDSDDMPLSCLIKAKSTGTSFFTSICNIMYSCNVK